MSKQKVVVVTPCYNNSKDLKECIDSALSQTHKCDIVVVDDGSTDNSRDIILSYGNKVTSIFQGNAGPGAARNKGVSKAIKMGANYIQLCDADDYMVDTKVSTLIEIGEAHKEVGVIMDDYWHLYDDPAVCPKFRTREYKRSSTHETLWAQNLVYCNALVKSWVFEMCKHINGYYYDETMRVAQDYDFWLRAYKHCVFWHHPEPLSYWRIGPNNSADNIMGQVRYECMKKLKQKNAPLYE